MTLSLTQFIAVLRGRWKLALAVLATTVLLALAVTLLMTKKYTASASVVMDVKPDPLTGMVAGGGVNATLMATQVDIVESDRVTRRVIQNLKLDQNPALRAAWVSATNGVGTMEDWLARVLAVSLDVRPSRESNVMFVSYEAADPDFAATMANAYVQAYMQTTLELRVDPARQYSDFFDQRSKDARNTLEAAQAKLSDFQREHGVIGSDERIDVETMRLNELSSQLVTLQALSSESQSRQAQVRGGHSDQLAETLTNPVVSSLKLDLGRAEGNLKELGMRLGANHPQVQQAQTQVAELRNRLASEMARASGSVGVSASINAARLGDLRTQLDQQRTKLLSLKQVRDSMGVLQRDVDNAQRVYDLLAGRQSQTALETHVQQSNVNPLSPAVVPASASSPKRLLNLVASVFAGLFFAALAALVAELRDRRVRGPGDLVQALGLPMLGVLPTPRNPKLNAQQLKQRVVTGRALTPARR
ncbi:MAG TPA: chain length determinant protein EpsF [Ideonella sp.]|uniref:chain length determinant protein EpsF n=1 Tax=Ideonella sp. TaxID=1929293 RepID=UPI002BCA5B58|nr:chain length determinant protein EpsF [Ideonella sp.]HSI50571.1 chain length determinant protein EpsF [Ideonella sp.]